MAKQIITQLIDDIDSSVLEPGDGETVLFSLDGVAYEIDLSHENAAALRAALATYVDNGRRLAVSSGRSSSRRPAQPGRTDRAKELAEIREWAAANGYKVAAKGRVPESVVAAYNAAA